jgi:hypothetical protein
MPDTLMSNPESSFPDGRLTRYLDAFDPPEIVPQEKLRLVGAEIIPPLLGALFQRDLAPFVTHNLDFVVSVYRSSRGGMRLVKACDPRFHPNASPADTNVLVLARDSEVVGCVASRLIWCESTLAEEMESGRFWVSDPKIMWSASDKCLTSARMGKRIRSCNVVYSGSIYLDPSVRGGTTLAAMCRLHLLWLLCHWRWSWLVGLIGGDLINHHAFDVYGVDLLEQGVWRTREGDNELHRYQLALNERSAAMEAWLRPEMGDLSRPMGRPSRDILPQEAVEPRKMSRGSAQ